MIVDLPLLVQLSRLFIPVIAVAGIFIALNQYIVNREKMRFELYEKRFNIYNTIMNTLDELLWGSDLSREQFRSFSTACNEAQFLLTDDAYMSVKEVRELVGKWYIGSIRDKQGGTSRYIEELASLEEKIENLSPNLMKSFTPILSFKKF
jgi:hypothetical protein